MDVIRANSDPRQFITTNTMGWYDGFDHYVVEKDLDLAAWDDYVGQGHLDPAKNGFAHDLTRGFKGKNFWVMETQPGSVNWAPVNNSLDKGEVRAMAWHAIGHGADVVSYWQWRSALNGQEEYHGTLLGADGTPVPFYAEAQQIGREFAKAGPVLAGTSVKSEVAMLHSYDSRCVPGIDKQTFEDIEASGLPVFLTGIREELITGRYKPKPNRRVEIPKGDGKMRMLQTPCIRDRVVQGAVKLILEAIFEADFCSNSYGFRSRRSPHRALAEVRRSVLRRMSTIIDVDLSRYLDPSTQCPLIHEISLVDRPLL